MAHVYILKSLKSEKTYVGSTINLKNRLKDHNSGTSFFSKRYMPWALVYKEDYDNLSEARLREKYLKSAAGRRFIKKNNLINIPR